MERRLLINPINLKDMKTFRRIVEEHSRRIFGLAFRVVGNEHDAEDVVQETFLKAYRNIDRFDGKCLIGTWLYRIATRCALDLLRSRKRHEPCENHPEMIDTLSGNSPDQEQVVLHHQMRGRIAKVLDLLAPKERSAFILRHFQECSISEISEIMNIQPNAAKQAVFRAVRKLRGALEARST